MAEAFDDSYAFLTATLDELIVYLRQHNVNGWADWMARDRAHIEQGQIWGVDHLLSAFGGMGSLNDLVLHPDNGDAITREELGPANDRLMHLVSDLHTAALAV